MEMTKRILSVMLALALLLGNVPAVAFAAEETAAPAEATDMQPLMASGTVAPDPGLPDNGELFAAYVEQTLYGNNPAMLGTAAGERLNGDERKLYDALVPAIKQIAKGERASAFISIGQQVGADFIPDVDATFEETGLTDAMLSSMINRVIEALLSDLPFEMYWYDKTAGCSYGYILDSEGTLLYVQLLFYVAQNYQGGNYDQVDTAKAGAAAAAADEAQYIITSYASVSDYEKLCAYRDEICKLVSYNHDAAGAGDFTGNDDPWQLIYVFDGDPNTNVVCEGYSKAFMYLCDLTDFAGDVDCYTVSGAMDGGAHMWNIVTVDGANYLVDVTNSDTGTIGQNGGLFLAGGAGSAAAGYTFLNTSYIYDNRTKSLWGTGADSILTLASEDYDPNAGGEDENIIASGTCGENLTWKLDDEGTLTISGTGAMRDYTYFTDRAPWFSNRSLIKSVVIETGVTSIGSYAFYNSKSLTNIVIPNNVTSIGDAAFYECSSLTSITIPDSVTSIGSYAFYYCSNLTSIEIPDGVTSIGGSAFYYCSSLTSIEIPDGVTSIGGSTFSGCDSLTNVTIGNGVSSIGDSAFISCRNLKSITIPDSVTSIGYRAFAYCDSLTSVTIGRGVTGMGGYSFYYCGNLTSVTIRDGATSLGDFGTFAYCDSLTNITIPDSVTSISEDTFMQCSNLTSVTIGSGVTSIGQDAFFSCDRLTDVYITDPDAWCKINFRSYPMKDGDYLHILDAAGNEVTEIKLDDSVTTIPHYAFKGSKITSIELPDSVTEIGISAFLDCGSLTSIVIPNSTIKIGNWAFDGCGNIADVYFGGTSDQWSALYYPPKASRIHYNCTDAENHWTAMSVEADCVNDGYTCEICPCGYERNKVITGSALGHDMGDWVIATPATCTEAGEQRKDCSRCDHFETEAIKATGHTEVIDQAVAATCTETGLTEGKHCSVCEEVLVAQETVAATGHAFGEWEQTEEAGKETRKCATCGYSETREVEIQKLAAPTAKISGDAESGKPIVKWNTVDGAVKYRVYRSTKKTSGYKLVYTGIKARSYTDKTAEAGTNYYYKVKAIHEDSSLNSGWSNIVNRVCDLAQPDVSITGSSTSGKPIVKWETVTGAVKYRVYRSTKKTSGYELVYTGISARSYTDKTAKAGTTYYYKVKAIHSKSSADSAYSEIISRVCDLAKPEVTIKLKNGDPRLTWEKVDGAAKYYIYRATSKDGKYEKIKTTVSATSFTDTTAKAGTKYYYKVKAIHKNTDANSAYSSVKYITAK